MTPLDHRLIARMIEPGSRVLDLGCGDGDLMKLLEDKRQAKVQGVELNEASIYNCVAKGLSVFHGDIDTGLVGFPNQSFDYVILNQSLQQVKRVDFVVEEALRVGRQVVVGVPNFAYWRARYMLLACGRAPMTPALPYAWHDTPNLRFLSLLDFRDYCAQRGIRIVRRYALGIRHVVRLWPNGLALNGLFLITRGAENENRLPKVP
jgi:methionine biosynthesis protein MetW